VINPFNCDTIGGGGGNLTGIQAGIYEDCSFSNTVACQPQCFPDGSPLQLTSDQFVIGDTYFVFIDGCGGSTCQYTIDILQGGDPFAIPDPIDITCDLGADCDPICQGALSVPFTLHGITGTDRYNWVIDPPTPEYPTGEINDESETVSLTFSQSGTFTICGNGFHDCDESDSLCVTVNVEPLDNEIFSEFFVCENDYPTSGPNDEDPNGDGLFGWQGNIIPGPGTYFANLTNSFGCEYMQELTVISLELPERENVDTVFCGFPPVFYEGNTYVSDQYGTNLTLEDRAANGCDSLVSLYLSILNAGGDLSVGPCDDGEFEIFFNGFVNNTDGMTVYEWTNSSGTVVTDGNNIDEVLVVNQDGTYTLEIIMTKNGKTCSVVIGSVDINIADFLPADPQAQDWNLTPCENGVETYTILPDPDPNTVFIWLYPSDVANVTGQGTTNLEIDWSGSNGGTVCVFGTNDCGDGPTTCFQVVLTATPISNYIADSLICLTEFASILYNGNAAPGSDFTWNFSGGTILNGTNGEGPGPHEISWPSAGEKPVSLVVTENGCVSDFYVDSINVVPQILDPVVNCNSNTNSITFVWDDVNGADSYTVTVTQGNPGVMNGNSYTIDGLTPGDSISITVEAVSSGPCGNSISIETECFAQNCNLPSITLIAPIDSICADNLNTIDLDVVFDPPNPTGTGVWSGDGIVDDVDGIFDGQSAGVGTHTLFFDYAEDDCANRFSQTIEVVAVPTADFTVTDTICITQIANISYIGNSPNGNFNWDFDSGNIQTGTNSGPYELSWDSPGDKMITLNVDRENCASQQISLPVFVEDTLAPLIIDCEELIDGINFSWNSLSGATGYEVFINGTSNGIQTGTTFDVTGLMPGDIRDISIIAINGGRCANKSASTSCMATSCPPLDLSITPGDTSICLVANAPTINLDSVVMGGFGDGSGIGVWVGPGTDLFTGEFDPSVAGVGVHEIMLGYDENNCSEETSIFINVLPQPTSDFMIESPICVTDLAQLDYLGSSSPSANFNWDLSGGNIAGTNPGPFSATWQNAGTYDVILIVDDGGCVSEPIMLQIEVQPELEPPIITCDPSTNQVDFSWNNVDCAESYDVYIDDGVTGLQLIGNQTNTDYSVFGLFPGDMVEIQVVAISECRCPSSLSIETCEARQCPNIDLDISPVAGFCESEITSPFFLSGNAIGSDGSGNGFWSGNGVNSNGRFFPDIAGVGAHWIRYDWNEDNCNYNDSILVEIFSEPIADILPIDPTCPGSGDGVITIEAEGGDGNFSYTIDNIPSATNVIQDVSPGNHTIVVTDGNGCSFSESVTLIDPSTPSLNVNSPGIIISGNTGTLSVSSDVDPNAVDQIVWTENGIEICAGACDMIEISPTTSSEYCVTIEYDALCTISQCVDIRVEIDTRIFVPNVFSPNDDRINDFFTIFTGNKAEQINFMRIFDRWGEIVFETDVPFASDDESLGWDGKLNDEPLMPGVYVYVAELQFADEETVIVAGDVTLIK
jgi:gliding motility-associated-like protein